MSRATKKPYHDQPYLPFSAPWFGLKKRRTTRSIGIGLDYNWAADETVRKKRRCLIGTSEAVAVNSAPLRCNLGLATLDVGPRDAVNYDNRSRLAATANVIVHVGAFPSLRRYRSAYL